MVYKRGSWLISDNELGNRVLCMSIVRVGRVLYVYTGTSLIADDYLYCPQ